MRASDVPISILANIQLVFYRRVIFSGLRLVTQLREIGASPTPDGGVVGPTPPNGGVLHPRIPRLISDGSKAFVDSVAVN